MKEQVLPATKLYFVGVGTGAAAAEFAQQLGISPALCFGDEGGAVGETIGLDKGFKSEFGAKIAVYPKFLSYRTLVPNP